MILRADKVSKSYGDCTVFDEVSFEIEKGMVFSLPRAWRGNYNIPAVTEDRAMLESNPSAVTVPIRHRAASNDAVHIPCCRLAIKRKTPAAKRLNKKTKRCASS